jgi:phage terminase large subunit-like protein
LSVDLLILDELREHRDWLAWGALSKTTLARENALIVGISNAGDDHSAVLNALRSGALAGTDPSLGIFEWSAPDYCELDDVEAWAQACPGLGITVSEAAVRTALATDPPAVFRTELLCQHVPAVEAAIDPVAWQACADPSGSLSASRDRVAVCIDVAEDGAHVTLCGAAMLSDGRVRVEVLRAWESTDRARDELPELLERIKPAEIGWFPNGPAAVLGAELRAIRRKVRLGIAVIKRTEVIEEEEHETTRMTGSLDREACQGFAELVRIRRVVHPNDPLLNAHVLAAIPRPTGDGYRFERRDTGHVDAAYAAAGAVHLARTLPPIPPVPRSRIY